MTPRAVAVIITSMTHDPAYELVDLGGAARLERFGDRIVDRPHPAALGARADAEAWRAADLRFDRERGWTGPRATDDRWSIELGALTMELRPTEAGQVGLFPEHLAMLPWLAARVAERSTERTMPAVLNLFAHTGLATLALAVVGASLTHVDASRPTVAWARRNADASGLAARPIRWIVDDALEFTRREARRDRRFAGVILDPPSYGHGPGARPWSLEADLAPLLAAVARVLEPDGFVLLTAHTPSFDARRLAAMLGQALGRPDTAVARGDLSLTTADGRRLELGAFARTAGGAS